MPNKIEAVYPGLEGTIVAAHVYEAMPTKVTSAISVAEAWGVQVKWELSGPLTTFLNLLGGFGLVQWVLTLHLESIGPAPEADLAQTVAWAGHAAFQWTQNFPVAAGAVPADAYKPVISVRLQLVPPAPAAPVGLPIYGFEELPLISIY